MLVTHPLLDLLTIYGTQVLLPFTNQAWGLGSVFIIDPLVTLPWTVGVVVALRTASPQRARRANLLGLSLGLAYLGWGAAVQQHVLACTSSSGVPVRAHACLVATVEDGRIRRLDEYLDAAAIAPLMGS